MDNFSAADFKIEYTKKTAEYLVQIVTFLGGVFEK